MEQSTGETLPSPNTTKTRKRRSMHKNKWPMMGFKRISMSLAKPFVCLELKYSHRERLPDQALSSARCHVFQELLFIIDYEYHSEIPYWSRTMNTSRVQSMT